MSEQPAPNESAKETAESELEPVSEAYFLLIFRSSDDNHGSRDQQRRLEWLDDLRSSGTLLMSGPSHDRTLSICVVKAPNFAGAQLLADSDPWYDSWRRVEVIEWEIHFGLPRNH